MNELDSLVKLQDKSHQMAGGSNSLGAESVSMRTELLAELDALDVMLAGDTAQTNPSALFARLAKIRAQVESL